MLRARPERRDPEPYGVRIGTAEIYAALESVEEVADALIVNLDLPGGGFFMPLFVTLTEGAVLDDALRRKIGDRLRTQYTARHVPDQIIAVPAIPATLTGKKMEVPVRRILLGPARTRPPTAMRWPTRRRWTPSPATPAHSGTTVSAEAAGIGASPARPA